MHSKFKLGHNAMETTKNICWTKGEDRVYHGMVTRWLKKFYPGCKNLNIQARSATYKTVVSETVLQTIEVNPMCSIWRVSGEFGISQSCVIRHLHNLNKSTWSCWILLHITKILQNFWFTLVSKKYTWHFFFFFSEWNLWMWLVELVSIKFKENNFQQKKSE